MSELPVPTDYEELIYYQKPSVGLHAFICIDSTVLGPAVGGTRFRLYPAMEEARDDAIRLARRMTKKSAMLWPKYKFGGGKIVIFGDPQKNKTEALLRAYGQFIESLDGRLITAEDMGYAVQDVETMNTRFVVGKSESRGGGGNPATMTALGCIWGQRAAMQIAFGSPDHQNKTLVFQGVGEVGFRLARFAKENGAKIICCDIDEKRIQRVHDELGAEIVHPEKIFEVKGDIFVPCAGGGILSQDSIPQLQCPIVAGSANDQLADPERDAQLIFDRKIIYATDYVINAGGLINVACETAVGGYDETTAKRDTAQIYHRILNILIASRQTGRPPDYIADEICEQRLRLVKKANEFDVNFS